MPEEIPQHHEGEGKLYNIEDLTEELKKRSFETLQAMKTKDVVGEFGNGVKKIAARSLRIARLRHPDNPNRLEDAGEKINHIVKVGKKEARDTQ